MSSPRERLFELLPAFHRRRDAESGRALEALMALFEGELARVEEDVEQLADDWFIETCRPWLVPFLARLVEADDLHPAGPPGFSLRAFVANTIAYRRRKGTAAVLEELARDVTGWPARAVEFFQTLRTTQHLDHARPDNAATPDLRRLSAHDVHRAAGLGRVAHVDGPFDTTTHLVDVRDVESGRGKHAIAHVGLFLFRLEAQPLVEVQARETAAGSGRYRFDPVGRDLQLFQRPRPEQGLEHLADETRVPTALRRRALHDDLERVRGGRAQESVYFPAGPGEARARAVVAVQLDDVTVAPEDLFACDLSDQDEGGVVDWRRPPALPGRPSVAVDPRLGRLALPAGAPSPSVVRVSCSLGACGDVGGGPYDRRASVEEWIAPWHATTPWQVGVARRTPQPVDPEATIVPSLAAALSAWADHAADHPGAHGLIVVMDSATYDEPLPELVVPAGTRLAVVAADWPAVSGRAGEAPRRGVGQLVAKDARPHLRGDLAVRGEAAPGAERGELVLDGLLLEGALHVRDGDLGRLVVHHCTLGAAAGGLERGLAVEAGNPSLVVEGLGLVAGPIDVPGGCGGLRLRRSILGEEASLATGVLALPSGDVELEDCTVFGGLAARTLVADACILLGGVAVERRQQGCVRFSYVPPGSKTPRRFRCQPDLAKRRLAEASGLPSLPPDRAREVEGRVRPQLTSGRWGDAAFAQLARACAPELRTGAEDGSEMGAFRYLNQPHREANLRRALREYLRVGLRAGLFPVT